MPYKNYNLYFFTHIGCLSAFVSCSCLINYFNTGLQGMILFNSVYIVIYKTIYIYVYTNNKTTTDIIVTEILCKNKLNETKVANIKKLLNTCNNMLLNK